MPKDGRFLGNSNQLLLCAQLEQSSNKPGVAGNQVAAEGVNVAGQRLFPGLVGSVHQFEMHTQVFQCHDQHVSLLQPPQLAFAQFLYVWLLGFHVEYLRIKPSLSFNASGDDLVTFQTIRAYYIRPRED
jgi:hypothetical protein